MAFSKRFPKSDGSAYPKWIEVSLTDAEEREIENSARQQNLKLFNESIEDAEKVAIERNLKPYQTDVVAIAVALFDKRASHVVYHKEAKCKEKFDAANS